jgi:hypothetical protein
MKPILDAPNELGGTVGLLDVPVGTRRDGLETEIVDGEVRMQKDERVEVLAHARQDLGNGIAGETRHVDVEQNDIGLVAEDDGHRTRRLVARDDIVAGALEGSLHEVENSVILIDDEYCLHRITPSLGRRLMNR